MSLERFISAQENDYATALAEIRNGRKITHWMWYIFPQIVGLGRSSMSEYYAIENMSEARGYLDNQMLKERLVEISEALLSLEGKSALDIMGSPDDIKLQSAMTLFESAAPEVEVFSKVLDKFFGGKRDDRTLEILAGQNSVS